MITTTSNGLSQSELYTKIQQVFTQQYRDLGILRWMNRNKSWLKILYVVAFVITLAIAFGGNSWPLAYWAFAFIGLITLGGIDHFFIGLRLKRILKTLDKEGITIGLATLQDICRDVMPN